MEVALKTLNNNSSQDKIKLLQEAAIMVQFYHPNVLHLHGVARQAKSVNSVAILNCQELNYVSKLFNTDSGSDGAGPQR